MIHESAELFKNIALIGGADVRAKIRLDSEPQKIRLCFDRRLLRVIELPRIAFHSAAIFFRKLSCIGGCDFSSENKALHSSCVRYASAGSASCVMQTNTSASELETARFRVFHDRTHPERYGTASLLDALLKMCRNPSALQTLFFGIYNYNPVHRKHLLLQLLHQRQKTFLRVKCRNNNIYFYRIHILLFIYWLVSACTFWLYCFT